MKKFLLVLTIALISVTKPGAQPVDRIGVKGPLIFNKTSFNLAWTSKPSNNYYVQEYLPAGEKSEHFDQMLSIFLLVSDITTKDAVQQKTEELNERKKIDPTCNYMVSQSPDGTEYLLDFVLGDDKVDVEEFNIYRYKQVDLGDNKKAVLVYAYSKRAYGDAITSFLKNLKSDRGALLNTIVASEMPKVTVVDK